MTVWAKALWLLTLVAFSWALVAGFVGLVVYSWFQVS